MSSSIINKIKKILLIIGVILIGISFFFMRYDPYLVQVKTNIEQHYVYFQSRDGLKIKGLLYYPEGYTLLDQYPAVVSIHGINSRLEAHTRLNIELARRGFVVLGINLRGHYGSEGTCTLSEKEPYDIMGAVDYLYTKSIVNKSAIGIIGHSLGAMSSIRAAYNDSRINATIAIAPPPSIEILFSYYLENFDFNTVQNSMGLDFDITDPHELYIRSPMNWVNLTTPKNLFIQVGDVDIIAEDDILILQNATDNKSAEVGVLYGNFSLGTARLYKKYYGNIEHEAEPRNPEIIIDAVLWMENSLIGYEQGALTENDLIQWSDLNFGGTLLLIGLLLCLFPLISYIGSWFSNKENDEDYLIKIPEDKLNSKNKIISFLLYPLAYLISSVFIRPITMIFRREPWTPYNIAGLLAIILSLRALFLLVLLIPITLIEKKLYGKNPMNLKIMKNNIIKSTIAGLIISAFVVIIYFYLSKIPYMTWANISYPLSFILIIINLIGVFYIDEIYNRYLIQPKFNIKNDEKRISKYKKIIGVSLCIGLLGGISLGILFLPLLNSYVLLGTIKISFPLLGFVAGFGIFLFVGIFNSWVYLKTKNIIGSTIVQSVILVYFCATFLVVL